jgi:Ca2+-binding EF-hand superfamily protein
MSDPSAADGPAKDKAWLKKVFDRHDLNHDGRLTLGEFIRLTRWLDAAVATEECEAAFDVMDQSQAGAIDFDAFFGWWMHRPAVP